MLGSISKKIAKKYRRFIHSYHAESIQHWKTHQSTEVSRFSEHFGQNQYTERQRFVALNNKTWQNHNCSRRNWSLSFLRSYRLTFQGSTARQKP